MNPRQKLLKISTIGLCPLDDVLYLGTNHEGVLVETNAMCIMSVLHVQEVVKVIQRKKQLRCEGCFHSISYYHTYSSHLKWLNNARYRKLTQEGWDQQIRRVTVQLLEAS